MNLISIAKYKLVSSVFTPLEERRSFEELFVVAEFEGTKYQRIITSKQALALNRGELTLFIDRDYKRLYLLELPI